MSNKDNKNNQNNHGNGEKQDSKRKQKNKAYWAKRKEYAKQKKSGNSGNQEGAAPAETAGRDNNPAWYFTDANLMAQAASFSFDQFAGTKKYLPKNINSPTITSSKARWKTVTIVAREVNPSASHAEVMTDGINLAALKLYTTLSSRNSKITQYAPQDIAVLQLALGELISTVEHIRRAFGVAFTYNQRNRSMPKQLLASMGFDPDDFLDHIANNRMAFNSRITAINKIPFPANIAYFWKCAELYQKVYADMNSSMAQIYLDVPYSTWVLDEAYNEEGSGLVTRLLPSASISGAPSKMFETWMITLDDMIKGIMESSTFNYIYSDVLNYADKTGASLVFLDYVAENYAVGLDVNENYLLQFHNTFLMGAPAANPASAYTKSNDVCCDANSNVIRYLPWFNSMTDGRLLSSVILDCKDSAPSIEDRVEFSRWMVACNPDEYDLRLPDHYAVMLDLYIDDSVYAENSWIQTSVTNYKSDVTASVALNGVRVAALLSQCDWAPIMYYFNAADQNVYISGELNFYTLLDYNWFARVNDIVMQSLFELRTGK